MPVYAFTRSDGSSSTWPQTNVVDPVLNKYYLPVLDLPKFWTYKLGRFLAEHNGLTLETNVQYAIASLPRGYRLFSWHKHLVRPTDEELKKQRKDYVLFGRPDGKRYTNPKAFAPHAVWLMQDPKSKAACRCSLCGRDRIASTYSADADDMAPSLNPTSMSTQPTSLLPTESPARLWFTGIQQDRPQRDLTKNPSQNFVHAVRLGDLGDWRKDKGRRFRHSELVWIRIPTILQPDGPSRIDFWPAIIQETCVVPKSSSLTGEEEWEYMCHAVGVHHIKRYPQKTLFPFLAYTPSADITASLKNALGSCRTLNASTGPDRPKLEVVSADWSMAIASFAIALTAAELCQKAWLMTNPMPKPLEAGLTGWEGKHHQGLWLGAERVWLEDMVRLTLTHADLSDLNLLPPASSASASLDSQASWHHPFFLRVLGIVKRTSSVGPTAMQSKKRGVQSRSEDVEVDSGAVMGVLYEVINEEASSAGGTIHPATEIPSSSTADDAPKHTLRDSLSILPSHTHAPLTSLPPAPGGPLKRFRPVHPPGTEIVVGLLDIAGRWYPELERDVQATSADLIRPTNRKIDRSGNEEEEEDKWKQEAEREAKEAWREMQAKVKSLAGEVVDEGSAAAAAGLDEGETDEDETIVAMGCLHLKPNRAACIVDGLTYAQNRMRNLWRAERELVAREERKMLEEEDDEEEEEEDEEDERGEGSSARSRKKRRKDRWETPEDRVEVVVEMLVDIEARERRKLREVEEKEKEKGEGKMGGMRQEIVPAVSQHKVGEETEAEGTEVEVRNGGSSVGDEGSVTAVPECLGLEKDRSEGLLQGGKGHVDGKKNERRNDDQAEKDGGRKEDERRVVGGPVEDPTTLASVVEQEQKEVREQVGTEKKRSPLGEEEAEAVRLEEEKVLEEKIAEMVTNREGQGEVRNPGNESRVPEEKVVEEERVVEEKEPVIVGGWTDGIPLIQVQTVEEVEDEDSSNEIVEVDKEGVEIEGGRRAGGNQGGGGGGGEIVLDQASRRLMGSNRTSDGQGVEEIAGGTKRKLGGEEEDCHNEDGKVKRFRLNSEEDEDEVLMLV